MCAEQTTKKTTAGHIVVVTVPLLSADHMPRSTCPTASTWFRTRQDAQVAPMMCDCAPKAIQARIPCRKAGSHSALSAMMLPCSSSCSIPPIPRCPFKYRRSLSIPAVRNVVAGIILPFRTPGSAVRKHNLKPGKRCLFCISLLVMTNVD